ncbi:MAG TPA: radical SAM protein, partial [Acidimicrobiales bacterium]|nr:radical SAM protein [Acidimicrobiales bacterium]
MRLSRWTISAPVPGRNTTLLVQPLSGEAALLDNSEAASLSAVPLATLPAGLDQTALREMRILVDSEDDDARLLADAKRAFAVEMERTPTQLIAVPSFACNLACTYCYQEVFESARGLVEPAVIDALFAWIDRFHAGENPRPYLTLFGGEPLVDTTAHHDRIRRYLEGARARGLAVALVTNGYDLDAFVPLLACGPLREVQVTIDGPRSVHDARRPHSNGGATFERIVRGIDAMVAAKIPVNLRVVVDRANLPALPELARFADGKGWLALPETRFKTQVGRN